VTAVPGNATNLDSKVNYLAGLRLALTTAQKALSNHPTIAMKKQSLSEQLEMVMAVGEVVEQNNLFQSMTPMLQGIFGKVYTAGGITKRQAIERGWQFAKDLAISTKMTGLQIFQANLYAVGLIALKQNNVTNSTGLQDAIEALSTTYARLRPTPKGNPLHYFYSNTLYNHNDFLSLVWSSSPVNSRYYKPTERVTSLGTGSVQDAERQDLVTAIADLTDHFRGQANPMKALQMLDRTFQAATQVTNLHQDSYSFEGSTGVYYNTSWFQRQSSIHDTYFLQDIAELAFEIARVNPTVTAGANPDAEWVETLWEGGSIQSAAVGLSDFLSGFAGEPVGQRRQKMGQAIDYAGRLVKVADTVDDPVLDREVLKADFLSHLVNLGGAYTGVMQGGPTPDYQVVTPGSPLFAGLNFFMDVLWGTSDTTGLQRGASELVDYYRLFDTGKNTHANRVAALVLQSDILRSADQSPYIWQSLSETFLLAPLFVQDNGVLKSANPAGKVVAQSNPYVYTGNPPWEAKASQEDFQYVYGAAVTAFDQLSRETSPLRSKVYAEEQRLWAWKIVKDYAEQIKTTALEYMVTPDAIAGAILWEAVENPYPLWRAAFPKGFGGIPIASKMGIPGKIHVTQSDPRNFEKTVSEKVEDEGRVSALSKPGDWKERAKRLSDPTWAIRYIGAILDRSADIYEAAAEVGMKRDKEVGRPIRDYYNIRDQAGVLSTLYQGGKDEERATAFEQRRDKLGELNDLRQILEAGKTLEPVQIELAQAYIKGLTQYTTPQLPQEKMGPWTSQYRWLIRDRLERYGIKPFGIALEEGIMLLSPKPGVLEVQFKVIPVPEITNTLVAIDVPQELLNLSRTTGKYE
jgi:hypothetical protein